MGPARQVVTLGPDGVELRRRRVPDPGEAIMVAASESATRTGIAYMVGADGMVLFRDGLRIW